jgi:hypothetical protein
MRTATKVAIVGAGLTAGSMFGAPARSCVGQRGMVRSLPIPDGRGMRAERTRWQPRHLYSKPIWRRTCRRVSTGQAAL